MLGENDSIHAAVLKADGWAQLACAQAWEKVACAFEPLDAGAARLAWAYAAEHYSSYAAEYDAHLPASRWDHDYRPELAAATAKRSALPARPIAEGRGRKRR